MSSDQLLAADDWPYSKAKTAVLVAAASVIREMGPRSATLKNIAHRAGITEPAIFRHFDGVDGLFAGLFSILERFYAKVEEIYNATPPGMAGYLDSTVAILRLLSSNKDFAYLIFHAFQVFSGYEDLKAKTKELRKHDQRFGMAGLSQALERGELKPSLALETVGLGFMGIIHMSTLTWLYSEVSYDLAEVCGARLRAFYELVKA